MNKLKSVLIKLIPPSIIAWLVKIGIENAAAIDKEPEILQRLDSLLTDELSLDAKEEKIVLMMHEWTDIASKIEQLQKDLLSTKYNVSSTNWLDVQIGTPIKFLSQFALTGTIDGNVKRGPYEERFLFASYDKQQREIISCKNKRYPDHNCDIDTHEPIVWIKHNARETCPVFLNDIIVATYKNPDEDKPYVLDTAENFSWANVDKYRVIESIPRYSL
jgi:hypothetical protein